jgi:5-methylcytosine-specific restriction endonuclease McrA
MPHKDPIRASEYFKAYNLARQEKHKAYVREWGLRNKERTSSKRRLKHLLHPEIGTAHRANGIAKKKNLEGRITPKDVLCLLFLQDQKCKLCKMQLKRVGSFKGYHLDHIVPVKLKGPNVISNLQILCASCNHKKHAKVLKGPEDAGWLVNSTI